MILWPKERTFGLPILYSSSDSPEASDGSNEQSESGTWETEGSINQPENQKSANERDYNQFMELMFACLAYKKQLLQSYLVISFMFSRLTWH